MDAIELIPKLLMSGLDGDKKMMEATALMIIKKIRKDYPYVANEISLALTYSGTVSATARSLNLQPLPVDKESRYALVDIEDPLKIPDPILDEYTRQQFDDFLKERNMMSQFLLAGIVPPNSLLLCGQPGVGKTYIAHWISGQLQLPLLTLDLATSISSYLGRTGQNIRSIFEYAKAQPAVLFLDELDAIAKRRDDSADLGELKRLVNVLLKEIDDYPTTSILIGATNHPELLDKAIWRRFDRSLTIQMPEVSERKSLLLRHLDDLAERLGPDTLDYVADNSRGLNAADICKLCEHMKRQFVLCPDIPAKVIALSELFKIIVSQDKDQRIQICQKIKEEFPAMTQREIAQITRIPLTTVSRYLGRGKREVKDEQ